MTTDSLMAELEAEADAAPPPDAARLSDLSTLAAEYAELGRQVEQLEAQVNSRKIRMYEIRTKTFVDMLDAAQVPEIAHGDLLFRVQRNFKAVIPKEDPEPGLRYLEECGAGDLLDYRVVASFPKDSVEEVEALQRYVRERYQMATVYSERSVPWARLTSWVKEYVLKSEAAVAAGGEALPPLPQEALGITIEREVKPSKYDPEASGRRRRRR